jgi:hypothetical protein
MNNQKISYQNALQNLGNSHYAIAQQSIEGDDSKANLQAVAQTVTADFGNVLLGHVATTSLSKLGKMGNQLSKLGINSDDAKILSKAIANGDRRKVGQMVARIGNDKVRAGIEKLTGKKLSDEEMPDEVSEQIDKNVAEAGRPVQISETEQPVARIPGQRAGYEMDSFTDSAPQRDPDFANEEFEDRDPEGTDSDFFAQMRGDRPAPARSASDASENQYQDAVENQATETEGAVTDATKIASTASKVASTTEDVASGFEDATLLSTASDDTGVGLLVTAGLGIASLFTSLFMKKCKPKMVTPPLISPNNFSVQAGLT